MLLRILVYTIPMSSEDEAFVAHDPSRRENPPKILYKYMTIETARIVLSTGKLRFQSPIRYNDPFDSQWDIFWPTRTQEAKEFEQNLLERILRNPKSLPEDADADWTDSIQSEHARIQTLRPELRDAEISNVARLDTNNRKWPEELMRKILDLRRRLRVACFCDNYLSILMWSHYADQHRGVMLGFDSMALEMLPSRFFEPVQYEDVPPRLVDAEAWSKAFAAGQPLPRPIIRSPRQWALSKHTDWQYEKEWRIVWLTQSEMLGEYEDLPFPRTALVEVVAGCRTDQVRAAELYSLAYPFNPNVRNYRMYRHPYKFELQRREIINDSNHDKFR